MAEGGFNLRSWNTNCEPLKSKLIRDQTISAHGEEVEKLLGYIYSPKNDTLKVSGPPPLHLKSGNTTKRSVLSSLASVFDPLGLVLPVTVQGKILLKDIWSMKYEWDDELPSDLLKRWDKIFKDLCSICEIEFPRKSYKDKVSLYIFTDASQSVYGFCCYARYVDNNVIKCNQIFAKCKNAPVKKKTLPTLELLAVYLAFKCLPIIIQSLSGVNIEGITICVDAQIILSWILSQKVNSKNVFASNRVKEIVQIRKIIFEVYSLSCNLKYVPGEYNVSDLLTRGLNYKEFILRLDYWCHGPGFLREDVIDWPKQNLGCLSDKSKMLT